MELIEKTVKVPKSTSEFADAIANLAIVVKKALADGFQPGMDIPVIITEAIAELPGIIGNISGLAEEFKGDKAAFIMAWLLAGEKVFESF